MNRTNITRFLITCLVAAATAHAAASESPGLVGVWSGTLPQTRRQLLGNGSMTASFREVEPGLFSADTVIADGRCVGHMGELWRSGRSVLLWHTIMEGRSSCRGGYVMMRASDNAIDVELMTHTLVPVGRTTLTRTAAAPALLGAVSWRKRGDTRPAGLPSSLAGGRIGRASTLADQCHAAMLWAGDRIPFGFDYGQDLPRNAMVLNDWSTEQFWGKPYTAFDGGDRRAATGLYQRCARLGMEHLDPGGWRRNVFLPPQSSTARLREEADAIGRTNSAVAWGTDALASLSRDSELPPEDIAKIEAALADRKMDFVPRRGLTAGGDALPDLLARQLAARLDDYRSAAGAPVAQALQAKIDELPTDGSDAAAAQIADARAEFSSRASSLSPAQADDLRRRLQAKETRNQESAGRRFAQQGLDFINDGIEALDSIANVPSLNTKLLAIADRVRRISLARADRERKAEAMREDIERVYLNALQPLVREADAWGDGLDGARAARATNTALSSDIRDPYRQLKDAFSAAGMNADVPRVSEAIERLLTAQRRIVRADGFAAELRGVLEAVDVGSASPESALRDTAAIYVPSDELDQRDGPVARIFADVLFEKQIDQIPYEDISIGGPDGQPEVREMVIAVKVRQDVINARQRGASERCTQMLEDRTFFDPTCIAVLGGPLQAALVEFEKVGCEKPASLPGYLCQFNARFDISGSRTVLPEAMPGIDVLLNAMQSMRGQFIETRRGWQYQPVE